MPDRAEHLLGLGLYTPAEAGRLVRVAPAKIKRWLQGHEANGRLYAPLWRSQIDMGEASVVLGFRDMMEVRIAAAFIDAGLSPQRVRQAIELGREIVGDERPMSTQSFRTDGRTVFLDIVKDDGKPELIDLFSRQFAFRELIERSLRNTDYDTSGRPEMWWPLGRGKAVLVDPSRSFGQPIEAETSVPVSVLAAAVKAEGSPEAAARAWDVPVRAVKRAVAFQAAFAMKQAA